MSENRWARLDNRIVFYVCDAFLEGVPAEKIAREVRARFHEPLHRTQVYLVIAEARKRKFFQMTPSREELLRTRMMERFVHSRPAPRGTKSKWIDVVTKGYKISLEHVAVAAADIALEEIKRIDAEQQRSAGRHDRGAGDREPPAVHVGFGAGSTTMLVARALAERLRALVAPPRLVLHACSSGFNVNEPATAPVAFFNFFHGVPDVSYKGLFASAYVDSKDWERTRDLVGVRESFEVKDKLQVLITALASRHDSHGELNRFMAVNKTLGQQTRAVLDEREGRVGDVMYRPFNSRGPIGQSFGIRAVTLFELEELVTFAATPGKVVLLVAGPCGSCHRSRSDALMPLLTEPTLDVWTHLVLDDVTAKNCLGDVPDPEQ